MPFGFTSPGAMAGNAIEEFLIQRALEQRQQMLDEDRRRQQVADDEFRTSDLRLREDAARRQAARDTTEEEERQAARRQQQNQVGVRGMMADALGQGDLTPETAKTISLMAFREGMPVPGIVDQKLQPPKRTTVRTTGPDGKPIQKAVTEDELVAGVPEYQEPQRGDAGSWASAGNGLLFNTRTGETRELPGGGRQNDASAQYGLDTADRTIEAIDGVLPKINAGTAGIGGSLLAKTGLYQPAVDVSAELQTVAGNIAFNALQQMRAASKTGGALGSVAQEELRLLQSVEGSLRQDQSPANLKAQLQKVRASMERFKAAQALGNEARPGRTGGAAGAPQVGAKKTFPNGRTATWDGKGWVAD
ncbi:MAG TPA: hypothetical protein VEA69_01410 [Tepidisphaeraceae bacterium]|nr:hypothetical protein [Tepidisphaeraceae bacterium]